ncbi:hypothetical protein [Planococcus sp. Urea-trap-24]|uniref:hypothetical protein n=1 Tax=Planococcus sp. Urea-trap-24 TaxID=2058329 RepID=UPI000C7BE767|nr:hypothetical protein [Planococcus sp. Urea-trap-24]PKG48911.1 hypothetical protein CXF66_00025 [Planococcus sp. Urea-trap-24]
MRNTKSMGTYFENNVMADLMKKKVFTILESWASITGKYSYFGLPSLYMYDLKIWKPLINEVVAVEWLKDVYDQMPNQLEKIGFDKQKVLLGNIDEIILSNKMNEIIESVNHPLLIFLDYYDDLITENTNRFLIIEELFNKLKTTKTIYFVLLINHRNKIGENTNYYEECYSSLQKKVSYRFDNEETWSMPIYISAVKRSKVVINEIDELCNKKNFSIEEVQVHSYGDKKSKPFNRLHYSFLIKKNEKTSIFDKNEIPFHSLF